MKSLKERMILEINNYIRRTGDVDLDYFISQEILDYMDMYDLELQWYVTDQKDDRVLDIYIGEV